MAGWLRWLFPPTCLAIVSLQIFIILCILQPSMRSLSCFSQPHSHKSWSSLNHTAGLWAAGLNSHLPQPVGSRGYKIRYLKGFFFFFFFLQYKLGSIFLFWSFLPASLLLTLEIETGFWFHMPDSGSFFFFVFLVQPAMCCVHQGIRTPWLLCVCTVVRVEPRTLHMLGRHSCWTTAPSLVPFK